MADQLIRLGRINFETFHLLIKRVNDCEDSEGSPPVSKHQGSTTAAIISLSESMPLPPPNIPDLFTSKQKDFRLEQSLGVLNHSARGQIARKLPETYESLGLAEQLSPRYIRPKSLKALNLPSDILPDAHRFKPSTVRYYSIRASNQEINISPRYSYDPSSGLLLRSLSTPQLALEMDQQNYKLNHPSLRKFLGTSGSIFPGRFFAY